MEKRKVELYHSTKEKRYYFTGLAICTLCNKIAERIIMIITNAKNNSTIYCCLSCFVISEVHGDYISIKKALLTDELPKDAKPVLNLSFEIQKAVESSQSVFEAIKPSGDGERIIDKTLQCHNPTFMIQSDSKTPTLELPNGTRLMDVETLNVPIPEEKLSKKQLVAIKKLEVALINKERLVSESELYDLLNDYKNAEPLIEGPSNKKLGVRLTKNDEKEINLSS